MTNIKRNCTQYYSDNRYSTRVKNQFQSSVMEGRNLTRPVRKRRHSTLRKNIILHLAKHTQFITLQTGTSVRETSTLKHGSKYWKLLETLATFLLCFLNVSFYFASLSSIFVTSYNIEDVTLLLSKEIAFEREREEEL